MAPSSGDDMSPDDVIVPEINPMDFIDSCDVVVSPTQVCILSKRILQTKSEDFLWHRNIFVAMHFLNYENVKL
jgi:hypothetical protein